jgi:hypothetical protein
MRTLLKLLTGLPEGDTKPLICAYETVLRTLSLVDRDDPLTAMIAQRVVELAQSGVKDPAAISEQILQEFQL